MIVLFCYLQSPFVLSSPPSDRPAAPVNVSITHLRADSATVSWNIVDVDVVIGYAISQQVRVRSEDGAVS